MFISIASLFLLKISSFSYQLLHFWSSSFLVPLVQSYFLLGIAEHVLLQHNVISCSSYKSGNLCPSLVFFSLILLPTYALFFCNFFSKISFVHSLVHVSFSTCLFSVLLYNFSRLSYLSLVVSFIFSVIFPFISFFLSERLCCFSSMDICNPVDSTLFVHFDKSAL